MTKKKTMKATSFRNFLAFLMVAIILAAGAGFYFGLRIVKQYAVDVSHTIADANASGTSVQQLNTLKTQLAERQSLVEKANQLFATPDTYQTQGLKDIQQYASNAGVVITNTEFTKAATTPTATTSPVAITTTGGTASASSANNIVVTLQSPVSYTKFLNFLSEIEGNVPKLQITGMSIGRPSATADTTSDDDVVVDKITIMVATR